MELKKKCPKNEGEDSKSPSPKNEGEDSKS